MSWYIDQSLRLVLSFVKNNPAGEDYLLSWLLSLSSQQQSTLHTFAAGSLYLQMLTVFSAYSAVEIEEGVQANVSAMKEL